MLKTGNRMPGYKYPVPSKIKSDPQLDMRTWKQPKETIKTQSDNFIPFYPGSKFAMNSSTLKAKKKAVYHKKHKNWIAGAIKKPGALHRQLGVKQGEKIPASKLAKAAKKGGKLGKRARLAETLKGLHHKKHKTCMKKHKHTSMC